MTLGKMKVGTSLALGFSLVLVLLCAVTLLGIGRMAQIQARLQRVVEVSNVETRLIIDMRADVNDRIVVLRNLSLLTDPADMQPEIVQINEQTKRYTDAEQKLASMFAEVPGTSDREKALLATMQQQESVAMPLMNKAIQLFLDNKPEAATKVLVREVRPVQKS